MDDPQSLLNLSINQIAFNFKKIYILRTKLYIINKQFGIKYEKLNFHKSKYDDVDCYLSKPIEFRSSIKQVLNTKPFSINNSTYTPSLQTLSNISYENLFLKETHNYSLSKDKDYQLLIGHCNSNKNKDIECDYIPYDVLKKLDAIESNKFKKPDISDQEYRQMINFITQQLVKIECYLINQFAYFHPGPIINDLILKTLDSHNFPSECVEWFLTFLLNIPHFINDKLKESEFINSIKINKLILTSSKISQDLLETILCKKEWIHSLTDFDIFQTIVPLSSFGNEHFQKPSINSTTKHCENLHPTKHLTHIFNHIRGNSGIEQKNKGFKVLNLGPLTTSDLLRVIQVTSMGLKAKDSSLFKSTQSGHLNLKSNFYGLRALTISELINNSKNHSISSSSESENENNTPNSLVNTTNTWQDEKFKIRKFWQTIGNSTSSLIYLEINNADYLHPREFSYIFKHLHNLTHLILYCSFSDDSIEPILKLTNLQYLDVSHSYAQTFPNKKFIMRSIMKHLPNLRGLDISGTDLAGEICSTNKFGQKCEPYLIGLKKCKKRFEFLGLFNTPNNVSHCPNIPADTISGDANEDQILLSLEIYRKRPEALQKAVTDLFLLFRYSVVKDCNRALKNILSLTKDYKDDKNIVLTSSACLFYLFKTDFKKELSCRQTRFVISSVLECMENFGDDQNIIRNGLLTLFHFNIPDDLVFAIDRTVKVLVSAITTSIARQELLIQGGGGESVDHSGFGTHTFTFEDEESINIGAENEAIYMIDANPTDEEDGFSLDGGADGLNDDHFEVDIEGSGTILEPLRPNLIRVTTNAVDHLDELVLRLSVCALNGLVCARGTEHKKDTGLTLGAIPATLAVIRVRVGLELCDEVLEVAWSTLWNITDETPENCECFLREGGMELFMASLRKFPEKGELYRNMLGLLGNISEVPALRPWLMKDDYVQIFYELLYNYVDGIEVAYNSAGIISHLLSDGPEAWTIKLPRAQVLNRLPDTIHRWNIDSKRNINYRSLEPILRLLKEFETPQIQHWSVWALANLTKVYPQKYVQLLEEENGIPLLNKILSDSRPYEKIKQLATSVLKNIETFKKGKTKSFSRNSSFTSTENNAI